MTTDAPGDGPRVSVVIPVYNTGAYLSECLDSLVTQDLGDGDLQVVAVDDGSTDGSGELLDDYAARYPFIEVLHQPNSGWPGQPRNRGIDASRGRYVFFLDSDDWLTGDALRRLCDFADAQDADIVVPRQVTHDGKRGRIYRLRATVVDADLREAFRMLGPQKLFRRDFLVEHDLRFPEGKVRLEDGIFVSHAYLLAHRISMSADGDFYVKRMRDDGDNISKQPPQPESYMDSVGRIAGYVRELCPDPATADDLVLFVYRRKGLRWLEPDKFPRYKMARRRAWAESIGRFAETYVSREMEDRLDVVERLRSAFARRGDVDTLLRLASARAGEGKLVVIARAGRLYLHVPSGRGPEVTGLVRADDAGVVLREARRTFPLRGPLRRLVHPLTRRVRRGARPRP